MVLKKLRDSESFSFQTNVGMCLRDLLHYHGVIFDFTQTGWGKNAKTHRWQIDRNIISHIKRNVIMWALQKINHVTMEEILSWWLFFCKKRGKKENPEK